MVDMNFGVTGVNQKEELLKQLKTISEALDKQTENKVSNMRPVIDFNGNEIYKRGECPVCGFEFSCSNNMKYCFYCGQKLDWSEDTKC